LIELLLAGHLKHQIVSGKTHWRASALVNETAFSRSVSEIYNIIENDSFLLLKKDDPQLSQAIMANDHPRHPPGSFGK